MDARTLPLFLSRRALLPGATLGLPVLEDRYRLMMDQLEGGRFAVSLIAGPERERPGWHSIGTVARVVDRQDRGDHMQVQVVGERRFEVVEFLSEEPYPLVLVDFPAEVADPAARTLRDRVRRRLERYLELVAETGERTDGLDDLSEDPVAASYEVASLMRISNPERQELLELPTTGARLERELALLGREIQLLEHILTPERSG